MTQFIAPISFGLGDLVVSLPAVYALLDDTSRQTVLVTRSDLQRQIAPRVTGLAATVTETNLGSELRDNDVYYNLRNHPLQLDHWWGSIEFAQLYPNLLINDILGKICWDLGIEANFDICPALSHSKRQDVEGTVALIPGSDGPYKCWSSLNWMALCRELKRQGTECTIVGRPDCSPEIARLLEAGLRWVPTPNLGAAIDVISSCKAAVGVDTGLTHIAVQQGIATVGLFTHWSVYRRPYAHCLNLTGSQCAEVCRQRFAGSANNTLTDLSGWNPPGWSCLATQGNSCVNDISVEDVLCSLSGLMYKCSGVR